MNEYLNEFYESNAKTPFTQAHTLAYTMKTVEKIVQKIKHKDNRFTAEMESVGSLGAHVPSVNFSECDMLYPVEIEGNFERTNNEEYVRFKLSKSSWKLWLDCADRNGYLDPKLFSYAFYELVEKCLESTVESKDQVYLTGKGTVASTIEFRCPYIGVSVDLVVTVKCNDWPEWARPDWCISCDSCLWPKKRTLHAIEQRGIELVANNYGQEYGIFRLSFSFVETKLIEDARSIFPIFKKLMIIFKALRILLLMSPTLEESVPLLKSYHLKILMLNELTEFTEISDWEENMLGQRFIHALESFKSCVQRKFMSHLFLSGVNIFNPVAPTFLLKHELFTSDPLKFMEKARHKQSKPKNTYFI